MEAIKIPSAVGQLTIAIPFFIAAVVRDKLRDLKTDVRGMIHNSQATASLPINAKGSEQKINAINISQIAGEAGQKIKKFVASLNLGENLQRTSNKIQTLFTSFKNKLSFVKEKIINTLDRRETNSVEVTMRAASIYRAEHIGSIFISTEAKLVPPTSTDRHSIESFRNQSSFSKTGRNRKKSCKSRNFFKAKTHK